MNKTISRYLTKNILFDALVHKSPSSDLGIVIVIPCYNEPDIATSIYSLIKCMPPRCGVEVIVSINAGISDTLRVKSKNLESVQEINDLEIDVPDWLTVYPIIHNNLPDKKAGVGLGRKIGMDEAVRRFSFLGKERGIIVCFDADSLCESNYLVELENHFEDSRVESASINYEHPIDGHKYAVEIYDAIVQYELHLRYFINMQERIRLPYAFHTVGSSMACTVSAYCAVGGMNQRKAGEDFYFIHKLVKYGKHSELNATKVIPSPRISDRVPFGTGRAIGVMNENETIVYHTYHPQSFIDLEVLVVSLPEIYAAKKLPGQLPFSLKAYIDSINGEDELVRILNNTSDYNSFYKMFWHWFDAFTLMKYLHFVRESFYPDIPVLEAVNLIEEKNFSTGQEALINYRANVCIV